MKESSGETRSVWLDCALPRSTPLDQNVSADVCVVGAGITGLSIAFQLAREGLSVVVLDAGEIGSGETQRTTAHVTAVLDDRYTTLEKVFGQGGARAAAHSHLEAIELLAAIVHETQAPCDFEMVNGYLLFPSGSSLQLSDEQQAAQRAGLHVSRVPRAPLDGFESGECLLFSQQAQFHPLKYLGGVAQALIRSGARIFTGTAVTEVTDGSSPTVDTASGYRVSCGSVVVATNSPINDRVAIHTKHAPYRTYVVSFEIPPGSIEHALVWDTEEPYHYARVARIAEGEQLIVGGEDHKTGQANGSDARFARLEAWSRERFPQAGRVMHRWSGQVMERVQSCAMACARSPRIAMRTGACTSTRPCARMWVASFRGTHSRRAGIARVTDPASTPTAT